MGVNSTTTCSSGSLALATMSFAAQSKAVSRRTQVNTQVVATKVKKISIKGLDSIDNDVVRKNLRGEAEAMKKAGWTDPQGRKGKGYGVYRYADKYGANVDGYSPIYTPDIWSETGDTYTLGTKGLIAWAGLIVVLLAISVNLIVSTSAL